jgi:hypothetical protein
MNSIEACIAIWASTTSRRPVFTLPPPRHNMDCAVVSQLVPIHFSGGVRPADPPPPPINLPNLVPDEPLNDEIITGMVPQVSLIFFANKIVFLHLGPTASGGMGDRLDRPKHSK